jgi:hypothetical protein
VLYIVNVQFDIVLAVAIISCGKGYSLIYQKWSSFIHIVKGTLSEDTIRLFLKQIGMYLYFKNEWKL